jgi:hypothetical protein
MNGLFSPPESLPGLTGEPESDAFLRAERPSVEPPHPTLHLSADEVTNERIVRWPGRVVIHLTDAQAEALKAILEGGSDA